MNSAKQQLKPGQKSPLTTPDKINHFAIKWRQKVFDRSPDIVDFKFAEECWDLGFIMDMGNSLKKAFPTIKIENPRCLKTIINSINDIEFLGTAIFSYWRFRCKLEWGAIYNDESREWLLLAFDRLIALTASASSS